MNDNQQSSDTRQKLNPGASPNSNVEASVPELASQGSADHDDVKGRAGQDQVNGLRLQNSTNWTDQGKLNHFDEPKSIMANCASNANRVPAEEPTDQQINGLTTQLSLSKLASYDVVSSAHVSSQVSQSQEQTGSPTRQQKISGTDPQKTIQEAEQQVQPPADRQYAVQNQPAHHLQGSADDQPNLVASQDTQTKVIQHPDIPDQAITSVPEPLHNSQNSVQELESYSQSAADLARGSPSKNEGNDSMSEDMRSEKSISEASVEVKSPNQSMEDPQNPEPPVSPQIKFQIQLKHPESDAEMSEVHLDLDGPQNEPEQRVESPHSESQASSSSNISLNDRDSQADYSESQSEVQENNSPSHASPSQLESISPEPASSQAVQNGLARTPVVPNLTLQKQISSKRSVMDTQRAFQNFNGFDWDLKELNSRQNPPYQELCSNVFWYYVNSQYFPWNAHQVFLGSGRVGHEKPLESNRTFNDLLGPVLKSAQNLKSQDATSVTVAATLPDAGYQNNNQQSAVSESTYFNQDQQQQEINQIVGGNTELIQRLFHQKKFNAFIADLTHRLKDQPPMPTEPENEGPEATQFDQLIGLIESEVIQITKNNRKDLESKFSQVRQKFRQALTNGPPLAEATEVNQDNLEWKCLDRVPYQAMKLKEYSSDFLGYIDSYYVRDIEQNQEWYHQNFNEVLLNCNFPSKKEQDFFKHMEEWERQNNDAKYRQIIEQRELDDTSNFDNERLAAINRQKRDQAMQEDARCAICNSGEYEEETNEIVFCGSCMIPVHQYCYGIDKVPEDDWICNNCYVFEMKRGLLVKCMLCPRLGGAMKSTNLFTCQDYFNQSYQATIKKKGIQFESPNKDGSSVCLYNQQYPNTDLSTGQQFMRAEQYEDKTMIFTMNQKREYDFQIRRAQPLPQDSLKLQYLETEAIQQIPEDYTYFIQRNEKNLEGMPPMHTLYRYVHLSCAMWIPGNTIKAKAPVKVNRIDSSRFALQCIICGKKEGACMQCQASRCKIAFHVECARRQNYCMDMERVETSTGAKIGTPVFNIFCEKHRPRKQIKELEEENKKKIEEICKFGKQIDRWHDVASKVNQKSLKQKRSQPFVHAQVKVPTKKELQAEQRKQAQIAKDLIESEKREQRLAKEEERRRQKDEKKSMPPPSTKQSQKKQELQELKERRDAAAALKKQIGLQKLEDSKLKRIEDQKRALAKANQAASERQAKRARQNGGASYPAGWREKDKKTLLDRVKEKYKQMMTLKLQVVFIDPMRKILAREERNKRKQESLEKLEIKKRERKLQQKQREASALKLVKSHSSRDGLRNRSNNNLSLLPQGEVNNLRDCEELVPGEDQFEEKINDEQELSEDHRLQSHQPSIQSPINDGSSIGQNIIDEDLVNADQDDASVLKTVESGAKRDIEELETEIRRQGSESLQDSKDQSTTPYYRIHTQSSIPSEFDYQITFSKYTFPWHEIAFDSFTARECYQTYKEIVQDAPTFQQKVLGQKKQKQESSVVSVDNSFEMQRVDLTESKTQQKVSSRAIVSRPLTHRQPADQSKKKGSHQQENIIMTDTEVDQVDSSAFCVCRGSVISDFYVFCEAGEEICPYNGWVHPACTTDLCDLTQEQVEEIEEWYCESCKPKIEPVYEDYVPIQIEEPENHQSQVIFKQDGNCEVIGGFTQEEAFNCFGSLRKNMRQNAIIQKGLTASNECAPPVTQEVGSDAESRDEIAYQVEEQKENQSSNGTVPKPHIIVVLKRTPQKEASEAESHNLSLQEAQEEEEDQKNGHLELSDNLFKKIPQYKYDNSEDLGQNGVENNSGDEE